MDFPQRSLYPSEEPRPCNQMCHRCPRDAEFCPERGSQDESSGDSD